MRQRTALRIWALVGVITIAVVGVVLLLASLRRGPGDTAPTPLPEIERQFPATQEPVAATVNGVRISYSTWAEAFVIDQVMSGIAGQPAPTAEETLQRLISEELLRQGVPSRRTPDGDEIDAHIAALESSWGVEDAAVAAALERVGLNRAALERSVGRLLLVQASLETLQDQAQDPDQWLKTQRAAAQIEVADNLATPPVSVQTIMEHSP